MTDTELRARDVWHNMKYCEDPITALQQALIAERQAVWEKVISDAQRRAMNADAYVEGCDGDEFRWLNQVCAEMHDFASWCMQQAEKEG